MLWLYQNEGVNKHNLTWLDLHLLSPCLHNVCDLAALFAPVWAPSPRVWLQVGDNLLLTSPPEAGAGRGAQYMRRTFYEKTQPNFELFPAQVSLDYM